MWTGKSIHTSGLLAATLAVAGLLGAHTPLVPANLKTESHHGASRAVRTQAKLSYSGRPDNSRLVSARYGQFPLAFEANRGQASAKAQFIAHAGASTIFLTPRGPIVRWQDALVTARSAQTSPIGELKRVAVRGAMPAAHASRPPRSGVVGLLMDGANPHARPQPLGELPGKVSYFFGKDSKKWVTGIATFRRVRYRDIYPGVGAVYYGNQQRLEFDFIVSPHADTDQIALQITGRPKIRLDAEGNLLLQTAGRSFQLARPSIYQSVDGARRPIDGHYVLLGKDRVGIRVARYDHSRTLTVDPVLAYSTYLGGSADDAEQSIAVDSNGDAYVSGWTASTDFPVSGTPLSQTPSGVMAFVTKLDPAGDSILWSAYVGGVTEEYTIVPMAVDAAGNAYVAGWTASTTFPVTASTAYQSTYVSGAKSKGFLSKISADGQTLLYSTYLGGGGQDVVQGLTVDSFGDAFLTGWSTSGRSGTQAFPLTANAFQTDNLSPYGDAFVTEIDTSQSGSASLVYSTLLGGSSPNFLGDMGIGIAVDANGLVYVGGLTSSSDFPTTSGAYQPTGYDTMGNGFLSVLDPAQSGEASLVYSTYFGGTGSNGDYINSVAVDSSAKTYVTGTASSPDFPTTISGGQLNGSDSDAFVAKFDTTQSGTTSLIYSRAFGGSDLEGGKGLAVDSGGDAYVDGYTTSPDFPVTADALQSTLKGTVNGFVAVLSPDATSLSYATYWGGSSYDIPLGLARDWNGNVYVAGETQSNDMVVTSGAPQSQIKGGLDGFVAKLALNPDPGIAPSAVPPPNADGWNNSTVTVSFSCIPGAAAIQTCPSPVTVNTEGANQVISGTAVDAANNTATASDTVNLDLTPPAVTISSPANNASVDTPYVVVSGTITDALSGPGSIVCNGVPATLSGTNFSCTVQLSSASNTITMVGSDLAGNTASTSVTVDVSMAAPTSLTITPGPANIQVGQTQSFAAVDQNGVRRPDATWTVSDTSIASFVNGSPNTLIGNAAGQTTLTATVGSTSAQTQVTVLSGAPAVGTVLWSAPPIAGYTAQAIVQAVPTVDGPDLYSLDVDSSGDGLIRAFRGDGESIWRQPVPSGLGSSFSVQPIGDNSGGVLLISYAVGKVADLSPQTGQMNWQYSAAESFSGPAALTSSGTLYVVQYNYNGQNADALHAIDTTTGTLASQTPLPTSSYSETVQGNTPGWDCNYQYPPSPTTGGGPVGPPMVTPDGSVYLEVESQQTERLDTWSADGTQCTTTYTYTENLSLLSVSGGGPQYQQIASYSTSDWNYSAGNLAPYHSPGEVIPDGNGGVLATWVSAADGRGGTEKYPTTLADIRGGGIATSDLPGFQTIGQNQNPIEMLVLGDNGTGYVTNESSVISFNTTTLQQNWQYPSAGGFLSLVAATSEGGVTIDDSQQGIIQLDSNGNGSAPIASLQGAAPFDMFSWQEISNGVLALAWSPSGSSGVLNTLAAMPAPLPEGNPYNQRRPPLCQNANVVCAVATDIDQLQPDQLVAGVTDRRLEYKAFYYRKDANTLVPLDGPAEVGRYEEVVSGTSIVCSPPGCDNVTNDPDYPSEYDAAEIGDVLSAGGTGVASVKQVFFVDRGQVRVFWPYQQFFSNGSWATRWRGALSQIATDYKNGPRIRLVNPDRSGATCPSRVCTTTPP